MTEQILNIKNLSFSYKRTDEAYSVGIDSLKLCAHDIVALTGVSGCGKSTMLECLGFLRDSMVFDEFSLCNTNIKDLSKKQCELFRGAFIGYMPQTGGLLPYLSIKDNIDYKIDIASCSARKLGFDFYDKAKLKKRADDLFSAFSLSSLLNRKPHELSIGQRQRAVFVKTLCSNPKLVLIDEPTSSLDPEHGDILFKMIVDYCKNLGMAALIVTHDTKLVMSHGLRRLLYVRKTANSGSFCEG